MLTKKVISRVKQEIEYSERDLNSSLQMVLRFFFFQSECSVFANGG